MSPMADKFEGHIESRQPALRLAGLAMQVCKHDADE